jgi:hypothetical protein
MKGWYKTRKNLVALGAIIILGAVLLFLLYQNYQSIHVSNKLPTQTSIFSGPVDANVINKLLTPEANAQISPEQAIGLAELYCAATHLPPKQNPSNIEANRMTEKAALARLDSQVTDLSNKIVWLVSMDGMWEHKPPPAGPDETSVPILFRHCNVIIDARIGDMESLTN